MKILVADDEQLILDLMDMVLMSAGHTVRAVLNGEQALKALEAEPFDVVFTDFSMPKMDGLVLAKEIKARNPQQKIVLLSGYADDGAPPPNVDYLLAKPVRPDALLEFVSGLSK